MRLKTFLLVALVSIATISAQAKPCQFKRIDPTCGPVLTGQDVILGTTTQIVHTFTFALTKAPANAPGFLAFSMKTVQIPLGKCSLLIDPTALLLLPFNASSSGAVRVRFAVKGNLKGTIFAQAVHGVPTPLLSNAQQVTCR